MSLLHCVPEARLHHDPDAGDPTSGGAAPQGDAGAGNEGAVISIPGTGGAPSEGGSEDGRSGEPVGSAGARAEDDGVTGRWSGLTSQGRLFTFDVFGGAVIRVGIDWEVQVPVGELLCISRGEVASQLGKPAKLDAAGRFSLGPLSGPPVTYSAKGALSEGNASGTISISHPQPDCNGGAELTWTAERIVCGDGHLTWPETCDPQDPLRAADCTSVCQLSPRAEVEPNGAPNPAAEKVEDDTVLSGSLEVNDVDVFAIHNTLAGTVALEIEVHTETVGTCHLDDTLAHTLLEVLDAKGNVIASDEDSSRMWFCSRLARQIAAGQTLYVRISSLSAPIPTYNLHVKFQKS